MRDGDQKGLHVGISQISVGLVSQTFQYSKTFFLHSFWFSYASKYNLHGLQDFTHSIFSMSLGRFEKRLRTTILNIPSTDKYEINWK